MIERDEILRIASLARLELSEEEVERMTDDLSRILQYVAQLTAVEANASVPEDAEGASPQEDPSGTGLRMDANGTPRREDRVTPSRYPDELLAMAPEREGALVRVPRVIEET